MKIIVKGGDLHPITLTKILAIDYVWHLRCPKYVEEQ